MRVGGLLLAGAILTTPASAQQLGAGAARWITTPHVTDYRIGIGGYGLGPLVLVPFAQAALRAPGPERALLLGAGGDLVVLLSATARPYLAASVSGGFLDLERTTGVALWGSWSAGIGIEVLRTRPVALDLELRYQALSRDQTRGVSIGARLGTPFGRGSGRSAGSAPAAGPDAGAPPGGIGWAALRRRVADAAVGVMGTPYRWGGNDGNGFDCSGLIRYAYAEMGIAVPRRSIDQARIGEAVPLEVGALEPGDVLAFGATVGGTVSHVGLYVGDGQFIHSATTGVRLSRLAPDDPTGRWWVDRWVGARRVLDDR